MPRISTLHNGYTIILEMRVVRVKCGAHSAQVGFTKDKSDDYIRAVVKEKVPSWQLVSIKNID